MKLPIIYVRLRRNRQVTIPADVIARLRPWDRLDSAGGILKMALIGYQEGVDKQMIPISHTKLTHL